jgi:uncharacterized membrane protein YgcG
MKTTDNQSNTPADIEENTSSDTVTVPVTIDPEETEAKKPIKRKGFKVVLFSVLGLLAVLVLAAAIIAEPWIGATIPEPAEIVTEDIASATLAIGDTKQIDLELFENETLVSFVSDCPEALSVDDSGKITAHAEYTAAVTATIRETEVIAPNLTFLQKIRSELRILLGLEERIDYSTLEPQIVRIVKYPFSITTVPIENVDFQLDLYIGDELEFELEMAEGETARIATGDTSIAIVEDDIVKAIAAGETTVIATFGIEKEIDGETVFMATRAKVFPLIVSEPPVGSGKTVGTTGKVNPASGSTGSTGGGSGGNGGSGGGSGSGSGGGTIARTYPLPSEGEVASFVGQALGYANSLGLGTNYGLTTGNSGYSSPACTLELPWSTVMGDVYWQIDQIYAMLAAEGFTPDGRPAINITYSFYLGEWYIYVMWG